MLVVHEVPFRPAGSIGALSADPVVKIEPGATSAQQPTTPTPPPAVEPWYKDPTVWLAVGIGVTAVGVTSWALYRALG